MSNFQSDGLDITLSIEQLEGEVWKAPQLTSNVAQKSYALRRKPLKDLSVSELRLAITQQIGLSFVVPLAIDVLDATPLAEATYFPGDLLQSLLEVPGEFWEHHENFRPAINGILRKLAESDSRDRASENDVAAPALRAAVQVYAGQLPSKGWLVRRNFLEH